MSGFFTGLAGWFIECISTWGWGKLIMRRSLTVRCSLAPQLRPIRACEIDGARNYAESKTSAEVVVTASNKGSHTITISRVDARLPNKKSYCLSFDPEVPTPNRSPHQYLVIECTLVPGGKRGRWSAIMDYQSISEIESIELHDAHDRCWKVPQEYVTSTKSRARVKLRELEKEARRQDT